MYWDCGGDICCVLKRAGTCEVDVSVDLGGLEEIRAWSGEGCCEGVEWGEGVERGCQSMATCRVEKGVCFS